VQDSELLKWIWDRVKVDRFVDTDINILVSILSSNNILNTKHTAKYTGIFMIYWKLFVVGIIGIS
jgi:hypothetical protein